MKIQHLFEDLLNEINQFKPIAMGAASTLAMEASEPKQTSELQEIIVKSNRTNIKLLSELQQKLEEVASEVTGPKSSDLTNQLNDLKQKTTTVTNALLDTFDQLDYLHHALKDSGNTEFESAVQSSLQKVIEHFQLIGIEEIPVSGAEVDGTIMESIGTVPLAEVAHTELKQYQVYKVHQRGFRFTHNQEIIRKAKIISVI